MAPWEHLHQKTKLMPIRKSLALQSTQYLASALHPGHPSHAIVRSPFGQRNISHTHQSRFLSSLQQFLTAYSTIPISDYTEVLHFLHQSAVAVAVGALPTNGVSGLAPTDVAENEQLLPRPPPSGPTTAPLQFLVGLE